MGLGSIVDIIGKIGPVIVVISVTLGAVSIAKNPGGIAEGAALIDSGTVTLMKAGTNWFTSACSYVGFSMLWLAAFLAVYREGAEVILFYQALFNGASGDTDMIWFGFGTGCAVLAVIFAVIRLGLFRIPLRPFFIVTSILMYLMAVSFAGGGISSLQEAQLVPQTVITASWFPNIDWLGLYPTYESVGLQLALLIAAGITLIVRGRKRA